MQPVIGQNSNNIKETLDHVLNNEPTDLLIVCGSFFIMTDVRDYFGYQLETDKIDM